MSYFAAALFGLAWGFILFWEPPARDNTDAVHERSGMTLHTDAATGCQYLGRLGGLTPRLDASGKHLCGAPR